MNNDTLIYLHKQIAGEPPRAIWPSCIVFQKCSTFYFSVYQYYIFHGLSVLSLSRFISTNQYYLFHGLSVLSLSWFISTIFFTVYQNYLYRRLSILSLSLFIRTFSFMVNHHFLFSSLTTLSLSRFISTFSFSFVFTVYQNYLFHRLSELSLSQFISTFSFTVYQKYKTNTGMGYYSGHPFSTFDKDRSGYHCGEKGHGGWWYSACSDVNLNGKYVTPGTVFKQNQHDLGYGGVIYVDWSGFKSLKSTKMMFRRT